MTNRLLGSCLTSLIAVTLAPGSAAGQVRRTLEVTAVRSPTGAEFTLSVRGAPPGGSYRYVATMTDAAGGDAFKGPGCTNVEALGSGQRITWKPSSGTFRLTAYGASVRTAADTLSRTHVVLPPPAMLASSQTPAQPSGVTLVLRTDDLGPGHVYEWWMQYKYHTGGGGTSQLAQSNPWFNQTNGPMTTYPTPIPSSAIVSAMVRVHKGNPCQVIAAGAMGPNQ